MTKTKRAYTSKSKSSSRLIKIQGTRQRQHKKVLRVDLIQFPQCQDVIKLFSLFVCWFQLGLISQPIVFSSHNKPAPAELISPETNQRTRRLSVANMTKKVIYLWENVGNNSAAHDRNESREAQKEHSCVQALCNYVHACSNLYRNENQSEKMLNQL